jgi:RNA recognition motif-containing protein
MEMGYDPSDGLEISTADNSPKLSQRSHGERPQSAQDDQRATSGSNAPSTASTSAVSGKTSSAPVPAVAQQTRHARRIYVGGIPTGYSDEETLKSFLNSVIAKGLNEENDNSYVLSVYINQKKCFTFVEFKSIELTTACLELDGLIYYSNVLKVLRANEYKPELLPLSHNPPIKLYLPASAFGTPTIGPTAQPCCWDSPGGNNDLRLDYSFIQTVSLTCIERDSIVLIGFPYDNSMRKSTSRAGSSVSPKAIRHILKKFGAGSLHNPEYGADISKVSPSHPLLRHLYAILIKSMYGLFLN